MKVKIGTILKNVRLNSGKGFTQRAEGHKIGLANNTISSYEKNNRQPDFETINNILKVNGYKLLILDNKENAINLEKYSIDPDE